MNGPVTASTATMTGAPQPRALDDPLPPVRAAVRELLLSTPAFQQLDPASRRSLAAAMVKVCHAAASLIREELESDEAAREAMAREGDSGASAAAAQPMAAAPLSAASSRASRSSASSRPPLARAQGTGADFTPGAAQQIGDVTRSVLNAVSFPRFVGELITGVFKAMIDSSIQQMNAYVELLNNVAATLDGFADSNIGADRARAWLVERYPGSFEITGGDPEDEEDRDPDEPPPPRTVRLRPGAQMPSPEALRTDLGLGANDSIPTGDPERTLVPLARRQLAQQRQQMLATMVMLGMQRIVVDSGRITAAMRFHIDTRSAAQEDRASRFDFRNQSTASGSFSAGQWGASASVSNTIGYVNTQRSMSSEEMNTDLDLSSSVEINFRSDYLPLNRMASGEQAARIQANTLNPEAEARIASDERRERRRAAAGDEETRRQRLEGDLRPTEPARPGASEPGSIEHADSLRRSAATQPRAGGSTTPPPAGSSTTPPPAGSSTTPPPAGSSTTPPPAGSSTTPPPASSSTTPPPAGSSTTPPRAGGSTTPPPAGGPATAR